MFEWALVGLRPSEWKQRLNIALDVSYGVESFEFFFCLVAGTTFTFLNENSFSFDFFY